MNKILKHRSELKYLEEKTLLNFAATAPISDAICTEMHNVCNQMKAPLGSHFYKSLGLLESTRQKLAAFIGASSSEVAFTQNTSTSISMISQSINWSEGDIIIVADDEFPSNRFVWDFLTDKFKTKTVFIMPVPGEDFIETVIKSGVDLKQVKLLAISPVSYKTGRLYKLKEICDFCTENDIYSFFDAIQAIGVIDLDVKKLGVDFLVGGAQKWLLGPIGCGYLYVSSKHHNIVQSPLVGWCSLEYPEKFELKTQRLADEMTQFEPGLPNLFSIAGLSKSLDNFNEIGLDVISKKIKSNTEYLDELVCSLSLTNLRHKSDLKAGIVSFNIPKEHDQRDWIDFFEKEKVSVTIRDHYVRVSPHYFTSESELKRFTLLLRKICNKSAENDKHQRFLDQSQIKEISDKRRILLLGGSGVLGSQILADLLGAGYYVDIIARDEEKIKKILNDKSSFYSVDVSDKAALIEVLRDLGQKSVKYYSVINCLAHLEAAKAKDLTIDQIEKSFQVNVFASFTVIDYYLKNLQSSDSIGFLNVISASGRCGYPLLSCYGASQAALWTMTESIHRENIKNNVFGKVYIASAMHSKIQKKIGRLALRFFKSDGVFNYEHADFISKDILKFLFESNKVLKIAPRNRIQILLNILIPDFINKKIAQKLL